MKRDRAGRNAREHSSRRKERRGARDERSRAEGEAMAILVTKGTARMCASNIRRAQTAELYAYPRVLANYTAVKRAKIVRSFVCACRRIRDTCVEG